MRREITPMVERGNDAQQIFLTFQIHEGKRAKYDTPTITGATKLPDATIIRATGWRLPIIHWWRHVTSAHTRDGVQGVLKKYGGKDRLMARVELKNLDYDAARRRVHPDLDIDAGPTVKVTAVETKVSRRVLKRYVPVFQERAVDDDLLETGKRNLQEYFQSQGYYDVSVDFMVQPVRDDQETVEYAISRGMRYKLVRVAITGNRYFDTESIRAADVHAARGLSDSASRALQRSVSAQGRGKHREPVQVEWISRCEGHLRSDPRCARPARKHRSDGSYRRRRAMGGG